MSLRMSSEKQGRTTEPRLSNADWGSLSTYSLNNFANFETGAYGKGISWNPEVA